MVCLLQLKLFLLPIALILAIAVMQEQSEFNSKVGCSATEDMCSPARPRQLPSRLLIGYANWAQCDDRIITAVENGVNVVMWFSINLSKSKDGKPKISGAVPDLRCVARIAGSLRERGFDVVHMISIGGWNAPLPDESFSAKQWFDYFHHWNRNVVANAGFGWEGFDGIDWDVEGHDDTTNVNNIFTVGRMQLIGEMSVLAKRAGYLVSMAPAQSYLDVGTKKFDLRVDHPPRSWKPDFKYHGRNVYAYWIAKYGETQIGNETVVPTFDWVGLQLYEGWSEANYQITKKGVSVTAYLRNLVEGMSLGWDVSFEDEEGLQFSTKHIRVSPSSLVIGLANGWTRPYPPEQKFLLLQPEQLSQAFDALPKQLKPRGFMFWNIADEGHDVKGRSLYIAKEINTFLKPKDETP